MKMIDTKTLISEIDAKKKSKFIIEFNGIINMKRKIKSIEIYEDEDNINIVDREDTEEKINLLKHQIMKIEYRKNEYRNKTKSHRPEYPKLGDGFFL